MPTDCTNLHQYPIALTLQPLVDEALGTPSLQDPSRWSTQDYIRSKRTSVYVPRSTKQPLSAIVPTCYAQYLPRLTFCEYHHWWCSSLFTWSSNAYYAWAVNWSWIQKSAIGSGLRYTSSV
jgi:hypothetical protein